LVKQRKFIALCFFIAILLFLFRAPVGGVLGSVLNVVGRPFWLVRDVAVLRTHNLLALFESKVALENENRTLKDQLTSNKLDLLTQEALRGENEALKEAFSRKINKPRLVARVLATPPRSPYDTLLIDAGTHMQVTKGMAAFTDGDFKVGEVTDVFANSAVVTLYSKSGTELPVVVHTDTGTSTASSTLRTLHTVAVVAHGVGGGNFRIVLPKGTTVQVGNLVEIPLLAPTYAGTIDAIERPEGTSLQTLFVRLPLNLSDIRLVYLAPSIPLLPMATSSLQ